MVQGLAAGTVAGSLGPGPGTVGGALLGGTTAAIGGCANGLFKHNI